MARRAPIGAHDQAEEVLAAPGELLRPFQRVQAHLTGGGAAARDGPVELLARQCASISYGRKGLSGRIWFRTNSVTASLRSFGHFR